MNEIIENTFIFIDDLEKSDLIKELTEYILPKVLELCGEGEISGKGSQYGG